MEWIATAVMGGAVGAIGLAVIALWRRVRRVERAVQPCMRVHLADLPLVIAPAGAGERSSGPPIAVEDLPAFRAAPPRTLDEDEVNPVLRAGR